MSKHTPGPWVKGVMSDYVAKSASGEIIAELPCSKASSEERAANARLIAAAPDLLGALKRAMNELAQCTQGDGCNYCLARAAIAKAEGK